MPGSNNNPYVRASCGHWTTSEYCQKRGASVFVHVKTLEEGGRLTKKGELDTRCKELRTNILCAKCYAQTPEGSEERKARLTLKKEYYMRHEKMRDNLSFYCPRCGESVRPMTDSSALEATLNNWLDLEKARRALIVAHYRHVHTEYESELENIKLKHYEEAKEMLLNLDESRADLAVKVNRLRREYNGYAIELAKEDGLLPQQNGEEEKQGEGLVCGKGET